jgi:tetratricopeptide (TPR) repeat protein
MHYYLHAMEGSPHPERALAYASILPSLAPTIGHIVHMPAHIYIRTGDYLAAEDACERAAKVDEQHIQGSAHPGMFTILSYLHDLYFLATAASMDGHYTISREASNKLAGEVSVHVEEMPELQAFLTVQPAVLVRFNRWTEILTLRANNSHLRVTNAMLSFARGMAFAATGRLAEAESEANALAKILEQTPPEEPFAMSSNKTRDVFEIAADVLSAKLSMSRGQKSQAIAQFREAVAIQDGLKYSEPPSWFYPLRESLGAALFLNDQAPEAEQTFRDDLQRNPRNPRSLYGLLTALRSLGKSHDAEFVQAELDAAWKGDLQQLDLRNF